VALVAATGTAAGISFRGPEPPAKAPEHLWRINADIEDMAQARRLSKALSEGQERIERFFGRPFKRAFEVEIFPSRARFDDYFRKRWQVPKTEAWMVASGVADKLTILSPRVWKTEAAEHDPQDDKHYRELVAHELVHVYHGQHNPTGDFDGMDDLGWFVEGLAVYVSGQLDNSHRDAARQAIAEGKAPTSLAKAWSGKHRYGVCGSLVRYVDKRWGRDELRVLMAETKPDEALRRLGISEKDFLRAWTEDVRASAKP
jgi:hypothetical protein